MFLAPILKVARAIGRFVWRLNRQGRQVEVDFDDGSSVEIGPVKLTIFGDAAAQSATAFAELYSPAHGFSPDAPAVAVVVDPPVVQFSAPIPDDPSNSAEPDQVDGGQDEPTYDGPDF